MNKIYNKKFEFVNGQACALWFSVEPNGEMCGNYPIEIEIFSEDEKLLAKKVFNINIIDKELPRQKLINTCWFHGDCIAKLHNVEINSSEYFEIVEKYLSIYTKFGHNMILTPIFTPPLDTDVGSERPTNQLVNVFLHNGEYSFNFENLGYWIKLCKKYGVPFVINDNVEIAKKIDADGVHVGQSDMEALNVRELLGPDKIIGVSTQTVEQALKAEAHGADYLGVGAVFPTGSKDDAEVLDRSTLKAICDAVHIPVIAIGGITHDNVKELGGSGICGIAVISAIFAQPDIEHATGELKKAVIDMLKK